MLFDISCVLPKSKDVVVYKYDNMSNMVWGPDGKVIDFWKDPRFKDSRGVGMLRVRKDFCPERPIVGKNRRVSRLKIQLGTACNYHCKYCMQASYRTQVKQATPEQVQAFVDNLKEQGITFTQNGGIQLWGGEPLVYIKTLRILIPLLRKAYGNAIMMSVVTNGSLLTREIVDFFIQYRVQVVISHDAQGFSLRDDKDPLFDAEKKSVWLYLLEKSREAHIEMSFNVVLTPANADLFAIREFFDKNFARNVRFSIEGIVTAESDAVNTHFTAEKARMLDNSIFKAIVQDWENWPQLMEYVESLLARIVHRSPANTIHGKCEAPSHSVLITDLFGRIISCQNRDASRYTIGSLNDLKNVRNNHLTHWSQRAYCKNCPFLSSCKGSCPHMTDEELKTTCKNEALLHQAIFSATWFCLTGHIVLGIAPSKEQTPWTGWTGDERDIGKLYLMLGHACNFKCRHCYQADVPMPRLNKKVDPSVIEYLKHVSSVHERKVNFVFWGGEPLLYLPMIKQVINELGDDAFDFWMMSNGALLTDEIVDYLNAHGIGFSVSNDGPDTAKIRGINILENEEFLRCFKRIKKTCVGCCTHAYNIDPKKTVAYIKSKVGNKTSIYYQYHLECTHPMDNDLYAYNLEAYRKNIRELCEEYFDDIREGRQDTPSIYAVEKGIKAAENFHRRRAWGMPDVWLPECMPLRNEINIDIHGTVHACHNRLSPIGTIQDSFETLKTASDTYFGKAVSQKKECEDCSINHICRHGCPLNPMSDGQRECCKAEKIYWEECEKAWLSHVGLMVPKKIPIVLGESKR